MVSREKRSCETLLRFAVDPDGKVVLDLAQKLPGRGVWIIPTASHIQAAIKKDLFSKGFKAPVRIEVDFLDQVGVQLRKSALKNLSLCNKVGLVIWGYERVKAALKANHLEYGVVALEASLDIEKKLYVGSGRPISVIKIFSSQELAQILGVDAVMYLGLKSHVLTEKLIVSARRCGQYFS